MRAKHYDKEGKFIFPFFIRYALRLYDGSTTMPSPPVLMIPNTCNRFMFSGGKIKLSLSVSDLSHALDDPEDYKRLTKWGDIVKSVDFYISSPIYTWDQEHPLTGNGSVLDPARSYPSTLLHIQGLLRLHSRDTQHGTLPAVDHPW